MGAGALSLGAQGRLSMCARLGGRAVGRPRSDRHLTASTRDPDGGGTRSSEEARPDAEPVVRAARSSDVAVISAASTTQTPTVVAPAAPRRRGPMQSPSCGQPAHPSRAWWAFRSTGAARPPEGNSRGPAFKGKPAHGKSATPLVRVRRSVVNVHEKHAVCQFNYKHCPQFKQQQCLRSDQGKY